MRTRPTPQKQRLAATALLLPLLALTACGTGTGAGAGSATPAHTGPPVTGIHWTVTGLTVDGRRIEVPADAHVEFDGAGRATGTYGCNSFRADAVVEGGVITVGNAEATEKGCPGPVQDFEEALRTAFHGRLKAVPADGGLTLTTAGGDTITLAERPPVSPAPLTGTTWTVDSLVSGGTAASLPAGTGGRAHLVLGEDGSVRGALGCNAFSAAAEVRGPDIVLGPVSTTRKLCTGPAMELESRLLETLRQGRVAYAVDGRRLTLTAQDGTGFTATAADGGNRRETGR